MKLAKKSELYNHLLQSNWNRIIKCFMCGLLAIWELSLRIRKEETTYSLTVNLSSVGPTRPIINVDGSKITTGIGVEESYWNS